MKVIFKNLLFGIKTSFLASHKYFIIKCLILASTTIIPLVNTWLWKEILNGITVSVGLSKLAVYLVVYLSLMMITYLFSRVDEYVNDRYSDELQFYIDGVMIDKSAHMDLAFYDSASMQDRVNRAKSNFGIMTDMTWLVFNILSEVINIIAIFIIVCSYRWWLGIITLAFLIPFSIYNKKKAERDLCLEEKLIRDNRKLSFIIEAFFDSDIQFEMRLNNTGDYFLSVFKKINQKFNKIFRNNNIRHHVISTILHIFNLLSEILVITVSAFDVVNREIGIGDLQYNLSMVSRLRNQSAALMDDINRFFVNNTRLIELQEYINLPTEPEKSGTKLPSNNPRIEFRNVFFRYPNCEEYVLKDCSFTIEPQERVGLIGLNGAGKSTIIKLMFRFYDPEEGTILLDDVNIKEYDIYAVRKLFGVLFQDLVKYCLPLREIIALSDFKERFNDEKLKKACDVSGASEIIRDWEQGFDSVLGRYYADNGKDLSGGQWQLIGLARAYFKDSKYMILDEPSAALDPISEDRIFEQLYQLSEGKSSVTISHRLSNTTLADKILVIGDGHIIEQGSHFELLKQNGKYAELFNLQASKYI